MLVIGCVWVYQSLVVCVCHCVYVYIVWWSRGKCCVSVVHVLCVGGLCVGVTTCTYTFDDVLLGCPATAVAFY